MFVRGVKGSNPATTTNNKDPLHFSGFLFGGPLGPYFEPLWMGFGRFLREYVKRIYFEYYIILLPIFLPPSNIVICPQWKSEETQLISEFGASACKSLYKCKDCLEPFEHFKCI